jgi:hypothetical protein
MEKVHRENGRRETVWVTPISLSDQLSIRIDFPGKWSVLQQEGSYCDEVALQSIVNTPAPTWDRDILARAAFPRNILGFAPRFKNLGYPLPDRRSC